MNRRQLQLDLKPRWWQCMHDDCIETMAVVPAGVFCLHCKTLLSQYIPRSPAELGYLSADWAYIVEHNTCPKLVRNSGTGGPPVSSPSSSPSVSPVSSVAMS